MDFLKEDNFNWATAEIVGEVANSTSSIKAAVSTSSQQVLDFDKSTWNEEELQAYQALRSKRKKCIVSGCTSRSVPIAKSYHQLPVRNLEVWQKWVEAIRWSKNDPEWLPSTDQPLICSRHFENSNFISYAGSSRMRLNHTAIPTLYLDPPEGTDKMHPKFSVSRPPPKYVAFNKYKSIHAPRNNRPNQIQSNGNGMKTEPKGEYLEVTPELNFEDPLGYNGVEDDSYYENQDGMELLESAEGSEEDTMQYEDQDYPDGNQHVKEEYSEDMSSYLQPQIILQQPGPGAKISKLQNHMQKMPLLTRCPPIKIELKRKMNPMVQKLQMEDQRLKILQLQQQQQKHQQQQQVQPKASILRKPQISSSASTTSNRATITIQPSEHSEGPSRRTMMKMKLGNPNRSHTPQKHKIGVTKCRLIVQTIQEAIDEIQKRVAEQMEIPLAVVKSVWLHQDKINQSLNNS